MATRPTRGQEQAADLLADALLKINEAARLDGRGRLDAGALRALAEGLARASSAFSLDEIVGRALAGRGRSLGLRSGTADLILLMEGEIQPLEALALDDDAFRQLVEGLEAELGEV